MKIGLNGLHIYARHGVYAEESRYGGHFQLDVELELADWQGDQQDSLKQTLDYAAVYSLLHHQLSQRTQLLETLVHRLGRSLLDTYPHVLACTVRLTKPQPAIGGQLESVWVEQRFQR